MPRTLAVLKDSIITGVIPEFAEPFRELIACAAQEAQRFPDPFIGTEHLLLALVVAHPSDLVAVNLVPSQVFDEVAQLIGGVRKDEPAIHVFKLTASALDAIKYATGMSYCGNSTPMHLLLALAMQPERVAGAAIKNLGVTPNGIRKTLKVRTTKSSAENTHPEQTTMKDPAPLVGLVALGAYELQDSLGILWTGNAGEWRGRGMHVSYRLTAKTNGSMTVSVRSMRAGASDQEFGEFPNFEAAMNAVGQHEKASREQAMPDTHPTNVEKIMDECVGGGGAPPPTGGDPIVELRSIRQQLVEALFEVKNTPPTRKGRLFTRLGESILAAIDAVEFSVKERQDENARRESNRESTISMLLDEIPWLSQPSGGPKILDAASITETAKFPEGRRKLEKAFWNFIQLKIVEAVSDLRSKEAERVGPIFTVYGVPVYASDLDGLEPAPQAVLGMRIWNRLQSYLARDFNKNDPGSSHPARKTVGEHVFPDAPVGTFAEKKRRSPDAEMADLQTKMCEKLKATTNSEDNCKTTSGAPLEVMPMPAAYHTLQRFPDPFIGAAFRNAGARTKLDEAYYELIDTALSDMADQDLDKKEGATPALCRLIEACRARRTLANLAPIPGPGAFRKFRPGPSSWELLKANQQPKEAAKEETEVAGNFAGFALTGILAVGQPSVQAHTDIHGIHWTREGSAYVGCSAYVGRIGARAYQLLISTGPGERTWAHVGLGTGASNLGGFNKPEDALTAIWEQEKTAKVLFDQAKKRDIHSDVEKYVGGAD